MIESVQGVGYGRPATDALAAAIAAAQGADPLAPVTVVVPSNTAGLAARRVLGAASGLANVSFVTPFGLAQRLGTARLASAGQRPLTDAILVAAIRVELRADPGFFAPVAAHAATELALAQRYAELSRARPETLVRLRRSGAARTQALVELFARVADRLAGFADEDELARHAQDEVLADGLAVHGVGAMVLHVVAPTAPALSDLIAGLATAVPTHVIVALTGDTAADGPVLAQCARLGAAVEAPPTAATPSVIVTGTEIITASDVDEEVRAVVRRVLAVAEGGVPFERMAILTPAIEPYARTVDAALAAAGVPYNAAAVRSLADTMAGRALSRIVRLVDSEFAREELIALLACAPLHQPDGRPVPVELWDRISRRAGVVGGDDWTNRLQDYAVEMAARADDRARSGSGGEAGPRRDAAASRALAAFVAGLRERVHALQSAASWTERTDHARTLLVEILGAEAARAEWPESEHDAYTAVMKVLTRLAELDVIEPAPAFGAFARAIDTELTAAASRVGRFGHGVLCASIGTGLGLDLDGVFVLGLAEGSCPAPRREDALLADADRALAVDDELAERAHALGEQRREFLGALAAGGLHRVLSMPRGDLRSGRERLPSRWLLETASVLGGERVFASDFAAAESSAHVNVVASFAAGIAHPLEAVSLAERDLGDLAAWVDADADVIDHPLVADTALAIGVDCTRSRGSSAITRWDGNVGAVREQVPAPGSGEVVSATRLEMWAQCPFRYLLAHVLRIPVEDSPERVLELSPLDRGTLIHEVLERFVGEELARADGDRVAVGAPWPRAALDRILELFDEVASDAESRGLTGKATLWALNREEIVADLIQFVSEDSRHRVETSAVPEVVEIAFGFEASPPVSIDLPSGRQVRFRGRADRVDRRPDGTLVVLDYKTGRLYQPDRALEHDPVHAGLRLQLPLYAEAARQALNAASVESAYWYVTVRGGFKRDQVVLDDATSARFREVVDHIASGVDAGAFPAVPGEESWYWGTSDNCAHCDYDSVCPVDRNAQFEAKVDAPEFEAHHALMPADPS